MSTWGLRHSKGTWALGHSGHLGTWILEALGHSKGTWALRRSRHLGTQALKTLGHSGTWALGHSKGTWALEALEALYLANSLNSTRISEFCFNRKSDFPLLFAGVMF